MYYYCFTTIKKYFIPPFGWMTDGALQLGSRFYSLLVATIPCGTTLTMRQLLQKGWRYYMVAPCCKLHWWNPVMKIDEHWNPSEHAQSLAVCESHWLIWCPNWPFANLAFPRERWLTFLWDVAGHLPTGKHLSLSLRSSGLSEVWGWWSQFRDGHLEVMLGIAISIYCCLVRTMIRKSQNSTELLWKQ